jgi:hypothetical protein
MGRRQIKQHHVNSLHAALALKLLKPEHLEEFKRLYARCRTAADFAQVESVVRQVCLGPAGRTDRYGLLMQDDPLELEV